MCTYIFIYIFYIHMYIFVYMSTFAHGEIKRDKDYRESRVSASGIGRHFEKYILHSNCTPLLKCTVARPSVLIVCVAVPNVISFAFDSYEQFHSPSLSHTQAFSLLPSLPTARSLRCKFACLHERNGWCVHERNGWCVHERNGWLFLFTHGIKNGTKKEESYLLFPVRFKIKGTSSAWNYCNTLLQHTATTRCCNTLLQHTDTLLQHTAATYGKSIQWLQPKM